MRSFFELLPRCGAKCASIGRKALRGCASLLVSIRRQSRFDDNFIHRSLGLAYSQAACHRRVKANVSKDRANQLFKGNMLFIFAQSPKESINVHVLRTEISTFIASHVITGHCTSEQSSSWTRISLAGIH